MTVDGQEEAPELPGAEHKTESLFQTSLLQIILAFLVPEYLWSYPALYIPALPQPLYTVRALKSPVTSPVSNPNTLHIVNPGLHEQFSWVNNNIKAPRTRNGMQYVIPFRLSINAQSSGVNVVYT